MYLLAMKQLHLYMLMFTEILYFSTKKNLCKTEFSWKHTNMDMTQSVLVE